jgi:hypothetical protein
VVPSRATSCSNCRRWASLTLIPRGNSNDYILARLFFHGCGNVLIAVALQGTTDYFPGKAWSGPSCWKGCCWSLSSLIFCSNYYVLFGGWVRTFVLPIFVHVAMEHH